MAKVVFYGWKVDQATEALIAKMSSALRGLITRENATIDVSIIDVAVYGEVSHNEGYGLVFGKSIKQVINSNNQLFSLPEAELLLCKDRDRSHRETAFEALKGMASLINKQNTPAPTTLTVCKDSITVGKEVADIIISDNALRYIKELRELLGGGAIEITKGDLKIEIKEKNDGNS